MCVWMYEYDRATDMENNQAAAIFILLASMSSLTEFIFQHHSRPLAVMYSSILFKEKRVSG